MVTYAVDSSSL